MYIFQYLRHVLKLLPFQGATVPTRDTQGVASLALGWGLHWAFSPHFLNPKVKLYIRVRAIIYSNMGKRGGRAGVADVPRGCLRSLNQQLRSVVQKYRFGVL